MSKSNVDFLYDHFCFYFPTLAKQAESYDEYSDFELIVTLESGNKIIYEDIQRTVDFMNDISGENEWRRRFGMKLRHLMYRKRFSQYDLSKACGLSMRSLSLYMNGKSIPSLYNAERIARVLGCTTNDLLHFPKE